jgi:hypothetical protein
MQLCAETHRTTSLRESARARPTALRTARAEFHSIRAAMSRTRTGAVTSQGDFVQHSDLARSQNSLTGVGVTVGVLSDSYDCYNNCLSAQ